MYLWESCKRRLLNESQGPSRLWETRANIFTDQGPQDPKKKIRPIWWRNQGQPTVLTEKPIATDQDNSKGGKPSQSESWCTNIPLGKDQEPAPTQGSSAKGWVKYQGKDFPSCPITWLFSQPTVPNLHGFSVLELALRTSSQTLGAQETSCRTYGCSQDTKNFFSNLLKVVDLEIL